MSAPVEIPAERKQVVAAFDFDGTLTTKDSLRQFVRQVAGTSHFASGLLRSSPWLIAASAGMLDRGSVVSQRMV